MLAPLAGPFSHRALLTLAEKNAPYKEEYIDFDHKPDWCGAFVGIVACMHQCQSADKAAACVSGMHACKHADCFVFDRRLFDINPKGTVPVVHDLEADKWVPGVHAH